MLIARQWVWSSPTHDAAVADAIETTGAVKPSVTTVTATTTPAIAVPKPEPTAPVLPVETPKPEPVPVTTDQKRRCRWT
ncbi:MAG TPA: hypothetical protein VFQ54_13845 [Thermomicrobiales bacterium]|nr:hypothetical protein [Thermomicrobiales bacterium]